MSGSSGADIKPEEISDTTFSSSSSTTPFLVPSNTNRCLIVLLVVISLLFIWGVALLPAIFYANQLPAPKESSWNKSVMPPPGPPCNHPLIWNEKKKMCEPKCVWIQFSKAEDLALLVVDNFSISVSLLSFVVILATWIRIKQLRVFPHIIPLYIQGLSALICLLIAVGNGMGKEKAFCTSKFYEEALANPTMFCKVQGILTHYCFSALSLWFLVYAINLVQMIKSDSPISMHGHRYKVSNIICSLICWLLPWVPVGIVLGSKTTSYEVMNMRVCFPRGSLTGFFTTTFITELAQGIGCTCLLYVVYKLYLLRNVTTVVGEQAELRKKKMFRVVKQLVFLMIAYAVIMALTYTPICALQQHAKLLEHYITKYFGCLMYFPPEKCPKTYQKYTFSLTFIVSYLTSALFAMSTVFFLALNKQSRKLWLFWWTKMKRACSCSEPERSANRA